MNWQTIISDLTSNGWTQVRIAQKLGKPQSWVSDIGRGRYHDLKWADGESLRKLHARVMRRRSPVVDHA